ncbi:hypothetical protein [Ktedonospora formicarum]|uniref:Uncharacterized protein n=1 Tax=Ktedonospora formicarum TaxID=2778364 RepID=A0A8J3MTY7_9CHLR|nr:hypothetical protein [Ktedonospora formicarum]GHO48702.1 hypothetical protein KSX_68650 [Ktedonospora formicarum]
MSKAEGDHTLTVDLSKKDALNAFFDPILTEVVFKLRLYGGSQDLGLQVLLEVDGDLLEPKVARFQQVPMSNFVVARDEIRTRIMMQAEALRVLAVKQGAKGWQRVRLTVIVIQ